MSHIDSIDHSHVGYLFDIPLYHVMETMYNARYYPEYSSDIFILGGGAGEHGMMVLANIEAIVTEYLEWMLPIDIHCDDMVVIDNYWSIEENARAYEYIKEHMALHGICRADNIIIFAIASMICDYCPDLVRGGKIKDLILSNIDFLQPSPIDLVKREFDNPYGRVLVGNKISWGVTLEEELEFYKTGKIKGVAND